MNQNDSFIIALSQTGKELRTTSKVVLRTPGFKTLFVFDSMKEAVQIIKKIRNEGHKIEALNCYVSMNGLVKGLHYVFTIEYELNSKKATNFYKLSDRNLSRLIEKEV